MSEIPPSRYPLLAVVFFLCGMFFLYEAAMNPSRINAPVWVMYTLAFVWLAVCARLLEMSSGKPGRGDWFAFIFCAGFGAAFASIPWDGHPEACHTTGLVGSNSLRWLGGANLCQRTFGLVGFVLIALAIVIAKRWIFSRFVRKASFY